MSVLHVPTPARLATRRERNQQRPAQGLARIRASWRPARETSVADGEPSHGSVSGVRPQPRADQAGGPAPLGTPATHDSDSDWLRTVARVPAALFPTPGRLLHSADLEATGYADSEAASVGVDLARWRTPPSAAVDDHAWRRVFSWLVVADHELTRIAVLTPPAPSGAGFAASYGYEAEGVQGIGVLSVAPLPGGHWRIVDCWGDACHAERVRQLADEIA